MTQYPDTLLFIDGIWRPAERGATLPVENPATGMTIGQTASASQSDLDDALAAAERGFRLWRDTSAFERGRLMRKAAELLRARVEHIAAIMTMENGKPLAQSRIEVLSAADIIDWFAAEGQRAYGQVIPARNPAVLNLAVKHPVGVVAAFTPWNFPINQVVRKLSAALTVGCSMIVKVPSETPASPAELIRAFADAGLPKGVLGLVSGKSDLISSYLIAHPVVRKVSFTGSTPVGKTLAALAGQHMKRATFELGGHAPVIITADADLEAAVTAMAPFKFRNAGQVCVSPTRFLVQDEKADAFATAFAAAASRIKVGDGLDPENAMGPLINARRLNAVEALVNDAVEKGARLLTGGRRLGNEGHFYAPTVLADVPLNAEIMQDEPFGPVAIINRFSTIDAAILEANRLPFGLASYAWTRDSATATRLGHEIEAGMLSINHIGLALPELPFGGIKDSGYGTEGGSEAIEAYCETRFVTRCG